LTDTPLAEILKIETVKSLETVVAELLIENAFWNEPVALSVSIAASMPLT
jgi:hypothetical protein